MKQSILSNASNSTNSKDLGGDQSQQIENLRSQINKQNSQIENFKNEIHTLKIELNGKKNFISSEDEIEKLKMQVQI